MRDGGKICLRLGGGIVGNYPSRKLVELDEGDLKIEFGLGRGDKAFCIRCKKEIEVSAVLDNLNGDYCPTKNCFGRGWGRELFERKKW